MGSYEDPLPRMQMAGFLLCPHMAEASCLLSFLESRSVMSDSLWDPMNYTVPGILQARILEWIAFPFSRGSSQPRDQTQVSCIAGRFFTS